MRVQHNILAMNSYRNYTNNVKSLGGNLEKLSSGYKINRAGDDAAGLAISEKMRAQIKGLEAAQKNVKDATSFVKTAEGAMQEIQDMLGRMKYLATQSANGTYENDVDRENIQLEVDALLDEIDRIAKSANFNGIHMLKGADTAGSGTPSATFEPAATQPTGISATNVDTTKATGTVKVEVTKTTTTSAGTKASGTVAATVAGMNGWKFEGTASTALNGKTITVTAGTAGVTTTSATISGGNVTVTLAGNAPGTDYATAASLTAAINDAIQGLGGDWAQVSLTAGTGTYTAASITAGNAVFSATALNNGAAGTPTDKYTVKITSGAGEDTKEFTAAEWTSTKTVTGTTSGVTVSIDTTAVTDSTGEKTLGTVSGGGSGDDYTITMQIGDSANEKLDIKIGSMKTDAIKGKTTAAISTLKGSGVSSITAANAAIDTIKEAINYVSSVRGQLGAYQNRLDHTAKNLSVMTENIQDAESTIRDTDVAEEMMSYVKNNILVQSAQAMLAQANQVPQGVLQLLG